MGISDSDIKLVPCDGYGTPELIRDVIKNESPDVLMMMTDPRYFVHLFMMEHEIRSGSINGKAIPISYLEIWDSPPGPLYNREFYRSADALMAISKQTEILNKVVLKGYEEDKLIKYVPHGINHNHFRPLSKTDDKLSALKKELFGDKEYDFVLFFNSRNIRRKQIPDTMLSFKTFLDKLPKVQADKCVFVLHTQPVDDNGTDLYAVREAIFGERQEQVIFDGSISSIERMNLLYNLADATILLTSNEGWGLSLTESLMSSTMIIANVTGGMQDQMRFEDRTGKWIEFDENFTSNHQGRYKKCGEWAIPVFPTNISIQGSVPTPYISDDRCSYKDAANAIFEVYHMTPEERDRRGLKGREWLLSDEAKMTADTMAANVIDVIDQLLERFKPRPKYKILKVEDRKLKYLPNFLSE